jgi:hypothetical protein
LVSRRNQAKNQGGFSKALSIGTRLGSPGDPASVLRRNPVRNQEEYSIGTQEGPGGESRRPSLDSLEEPVEESMGVQPRQSGRTRQRSKVDPVLGFKEELGLESMWVQPITQEEPV